MGFRDREIQSIQQLLKKFGFFGEQHYTDEVMLKIKYELLRHDVSEDFASYFESGFESRLAHFSNTEHLIIPKIILILSNECTLVMRKMQHVNAVF